MLYNNLEFSCFADFFLYWFLKPEKSTVWKVLWIAWSKRLESFVKLMSKNSISEQYRWQWFWLCFSPTLNLYRYLFFRHYPRAGDLVPCGQGQCGFRGQDWNHLLLGRDRDCEYSHASGIMLVPDVNGKHYGTYGSAYWKFCNIPVLRIRHEKLKLVGKLRKKWVPIPWQYGIC